MARSPGSVADAPRERFLPVGDVELGLREWGTTGAPVVVVLHGLMGGAAEWDPLAQVLARRYHVVVVDQRGHGRSSWAEDYSAETLARDAARVIEEVGPGPVHLVGHSMGGIVALLCAATHPELIDRLVVIDVGPESLATTWGRDVLPEVLDEFARVSYGSADEAVEQWLAADPLAKADRVRHCVEHSLTVDAWGELSWRFDAAGLGQFVDSVRPGDLWSAIERIRRPTLLIHGELSAVLDSASAAAIVNRLPLGYGVRIPGGGHDLAIEAPEGVVAAVAEFLKS